LNLLFDKIIENYKNMRMVPAVSPVGSPRDDKGSSPVGSPRDDKGSSPVGSPRDDNNYFFERWHRHHLELFYKLREEKFDNFEEINKEFIAKRARMASAFIQGLKIKNQDLKSFKDILRIHDESFKTLLSEILNYYSDELIKVQRFRKVTAAYTYVHEG
jgi:hypothetical protein